MGRDSRRDAEDGGRRHRRDPRRHSDAASSPGPRMRAHEMPPPPPHQSRSRPPPMPRRGELGLQRSDEGPLRGSTSNSNGNGNGVGDGDDDATTVTTSSSSQASTGQDTPSPPPPAPRRLVRAQTVAHATTTTSRRNRDATAYDGDRLALTRLQRSQTEVSPGKNGGRRRPRLVQEFLSTPSSTSNPSSSTETDDGDDEDEDDDGGDHVHVSNRRDHDDSDEEEDESDDEIEGENQDLIEVVEEADDESSRERRRRRRSRGPGHARRSSPLGHPEETKHQRVMGTRGSPSPNELRTRRRHHHHHQPQQPQQQQQQQHHHHHGHNHHHHGHRNSTSSHKSSARRSSITQSDVDRSPPTRRRSKVSSVIEDSRPPVASHRLVHSVVSSSPIEAHQRPARSPKHGRKSAEVIHHETPPHKSNTVASGRSSNRSSSSRRPASILGSIFGGPPPSRTSPDKPVKIVECVVCLGDVVSPKAPKLKCGHRMCHSCLQRSFRLSITDPQHMPPKCCTQDYIPLKHVERLFDNSFKRTWNRKFAEYSTRNRIYCPARKCGEWIKPSHIRREDGRKFARCSKCKAKVCGACHGKWHPSAECPKDEETNQLLLQAKEEGWQRCFGCKAMVELKEGCNHMTCRCGAEFCMICGTKWKNCDCPWFNYEAIETDPPGHMNIPEPTMRPDVRDIFAGDGSPAALEIRSRGSRAGLVPVPSSSMSMPMPMPVPMPGTYEEEMHMRRVQDQRDAELARRMQLYGELDDDDDDEYDTRGGVEDMRGASRSSGHYPSEEYRHTRPRMTAPSPPPAAPTIFDRVPDYVTDVNRARGLRASSQERRLAERFSESRYGMGPRPAMGSPVSSHGFSPIHHHPPPHSHAHAHAHAHAHPHAHPHTHPHPHHHHAHPPPPPPPVSVLPPMGMPIPIPVAMPPPPMVPMMPQHTMRPDMYSSVHGTPPEHMMGSPASHSYCDDFETHSPRSRRPGRDDLEMPKRSILAGLTGPGGGVNRVYEWRNFVEPGDPEEKPIAGRA